jgi:hypothetical protein
MFLFSARHYLCSQWSLILCCLSLLTIRGLDENVAVSQLPLPARCTGYCCGESAGNAERVSLFCRLPTCNAHYSVPFDIRKCIWYFWKCLMIYNMYFPSPLLVTSLYLFSSMVTYYGIYWSRRALFLNLSWFFDICYHIISFVFEVTRCGIYWSQRTRFTSFD